MKLNEFLKKKNFNLIVILFFIACYTAILSFYSIFRYNYFYTHAFDFGIFQQIFWSMMHNGSQINTIEASQVTSLASIPTHVFPVNHLGVHFSPILYLFVPIYAVFQSPKTILIIQSFMLGLGALPLYLLTKEKTKTVDSNSDNTLFPRILCVVYLLYPALYNLNLYDFHEVAFAPFFILFTLYFLEIKKYKYFWLFVLLSLAIKEEIALSFCVLGCYVFFVKKERSLGLTIAAISIIYFIVVTEIVMPYFGQPYNFANRYYAFAVSANDGYGKIFYNIITHPIVVLKSIFWNQHKFIYLIELFYPVVFLPFFSGMSFILLVPSLLINLLSSHNPQCDIYYQYNGVIIPFLFLATINGYRNFVCKYQDYKKILAYLLLFLSVIGTLSLVLRWFLVFFSMQVNHEVSDKLALNNLIQRIPPNVSVASMEHLVPHLSARKEVWLLPNTKNAEYLLFDVSKTADYWPLGKEAYIKLLENIIEKKEYKIIYSTQDYFLLRRDI